MPDRSGPDFVIIGAMKCATSTLHDQLARQRGVFMSEPKEPNFFSNDEVFARGPGWYARLFGAAESTEVCGESSTHYTKLPTYPETVERMRSALPDAKLVYVMRDPIDRLVSQYIHEWTMRVIREPVDEAIRLHPELIEYSRYAMQLEPWLEAYGSASVLPVFFERVRFAPQAELERIARFIGMEGPVVWDDSAGAQNVSSNRMRRSAVRDAIASVPGMTWIRRTLLSEATRDRIKSRWMMKQRPVLSEEALSVCVQRLDPDAQKLGGMLGMKLQCRGFGDAVAAAERPPEWAKSRRGAAHG